MIRESRQELAVREAPPGPECDPEMATRVGWQSKRGGAIRLVYAQGCKSLFSVRQKSHN